LRLAITAFIAGGSLLLLLPQVPSQWHWVSVGAVFLCALLMYLFHQIRWVRHALICVLLFILGFAWNAHYADSRLQNILTQELEGEELSVEGRVVGLPQGGEASPP